MIAVRSYVSAQCDKCAERGPEAVDHGTEGGALAPIGEAISSARRSGWHLFAKRDPDLGLVIEVFCADCLKDPSLGMLVSMGASCLACGCTQENACDEGGQPCCWVVEPQVLGGEAPDGFRTAGLCSACFEREMDRRSAEDLEVPW